MVEKSVGNEQALARAAELREIAARMTEQVREIRRKNAELSAQLRSENYVWRSRRGSLTPQAQGKPRT